MATEGAGALSQAVERVRADTREDWEEFRDADILRATLLGVLGTICFYGLCLRAASHLIGMRLTRSHKQIPASESPVEFDLSMTTAPAIEEARAYTTPADDAMGRAIAASIGIQLYTAWSAGALGISGGAWGLAWFGAQLAVLVADPLLGLIWWGDLRHRHNN